MLIFTDLVYSVLFNTGNLSCTSSTGESFSVPAVAVGWTQSAGSLGAERVSDQKMETEYLNCWVTPKQYQKKKINPHLKNILNKFKKNKKTKQNTKQSSHNTQNQPNKNEPKHEKNPTP